jgi:two-component system response regulator RegX3
VDAVTAATVLVVEDEESYVDALQIGLEREGYRVAVARDGVAALAEFERVRPDLVLLDLMLPRLSGIEVCRQIRAKSRVPIIMVTAKDAEIDTVVGLEVGADDYVTKPYRVRELVARMRAVLRRSGQDSESTAPTVIGGDVRLDRERHEVTVRGEIVELPLREFEVLDLLMRNAGRVVTRETLIDRVWGHDYFGDTKTLDVHIRRIRSRIEADPSRPVHIVTIRGLGYRFEAPSPTRPA